MEKVNAGYGELRDFLGKPILGHAIEVPFGVRYNAMCRPDYEVDISSEASLANLRFMRWTFRIQAAPCFIICLYNCWGHIVKQWPEGAIPGDEEVIAAVHEALNEEGRRV